jgi:hypothetical protein
VERVHHKRPAISFKSDSLQMPCDATVNEKRGGLAATWEKMPRANPTGDQKCDQLNHQAAGDLQPQTPPVVRTSPSDISQCSWGRGADKTTITAYCEAGPAQLCGMLLKLLCSMHLDLIHPTVEGVLGKAPAPLATANFRTVGPKPSQQRMKRPRCSTCRWTGHTAGTRART